MWKCTRNKGGYGHIPEDISTVPLTIPLQWQQCDSGSPKLSEHFSYRKKVHCNNKSKGTILILLVILIHFKFWLSFPRCYEGYSFIKTYTLNVQHEHNLVASHNLWANWIMFIHSLFFSNQILKINWLQPETPFKLKTLKNEMKICDKKTEFTNCNNVLTLKDRHRFILEHLNQIR